jgi:hypothetical protein
MKTVNVATFSEYLMAAEQSQGFLFRGVSKESYSLLPKIGRHWVLPPEILHEIERSMVKRLSDEASAYIADRPQNTWEWLFLGQHHGMATSLLDWSGDHRVAAFFACWDNRDCDGAVYSLSFGGELLEIDKICDPYTIEHLAVIKPSLSQSTTGRIGAQSSYFTFHPNPCESLEGQLDRMESLRRLFGLTKIIIAWPAKQEIVTTLRDLKIHHASLFPDLQGIISDIEVQCLVERAFIERLRTDPGLQDAFRKAAKILGLRKTH